MALAERQLSEGAETNRAVGSGEKSQMPPAPPSQQWAGFPARGNTAAVACKKYNN